MSQATDVLQKILQLEEHKGFGDTAVSGGLGTFADRWATQSLARRPQAAPLIEAVRQVLAPYRELGVSGREVRLRRAQDLLARIEAGETELPEEEREAPADEGAAKKRAPKAAPTVAPLSMAVLPKAEPRPGRATTRRQLSMDDPVTVLKGVKEALALLLAKIDLHTVHDALYFFPRRYDDFSKLKPISALTFGEVETIIGTIWNVESKKTRSNRALVTALLVDDTGSITASWFGQNWLDRQLVEGQQYVLSGKVDEFNGRLTMQSPEWELYDTELLNTGRLVPVYRLTEKLSKKVLRRIMKDAVDHYAELIEDALPVEIRNRAMLMELTEALRQIHFPADWGSLEGARRRLAFDEFFLIQLGMLQRKSSWQHDQPGLAFNVKREVLNSFIGSLPFALTGAQHRVLDEILADLARPLPMARLVQGDVGSGKTVVAATALLAAIADGAQGALMAPTEILAEQHYRGLSRLFKNFWLPIGDANPKLAEVAARLAAAKAELEAQETVAAQAGDSRAGARNETVATAPVELSPALAALKALLGKMDTPTVMKPEDGPPEGYRPIQIRLLTGGMRKKERDKVYAEIADGTADLVIGTHALITEGLVYAKLGLVVIDEQHRFGVDQRERLRQKAAELGVLADTLVMTATPIPRSLALTIYGDLDISVIDEMPPGRQIIKTRWVAEERRAQSYNFIRKQLEAGRQAFIICPLVEESDKIEAKSAIAEHERLQSEVFPDYHLALLHGRMKSAEKDQIMAAFRRGDYEILVSTSVVEVGIDIPNATVMLVEGAERFGLSQLHQFRGRVGRGEHQSYCVLVSETATGTSIERLQVIEENHDGFRLAEEDLRIRGPGEFFGTRQSGAFDLRMARLSDMDTLQLSRREAEYLFAQDPNLDQPQHAALKQQLEQFWALANSAPEA